MGNYTYLAHISTVHVRNKEYRHALVSCEQQKAVQESDTVERRYVALRSFQREQLLDVALQRERQKPFAGRYFAVIVARGYER